MVSNVAMFSYNPQPRVDFVDSAFWPTFGYAQVVRGLNFQPPLGGSEGNTLCCFGRVDVPAEYINATAISCTSPRHTGMTVAFEVSFNGQDFTNSGVSYNFVSFAITRLEPPRGPVLGGTRIMVYLDTAPGRLDLFCRFGHADTTELVLATISSNDTRIECRSPSRPAGTVPFSIMFVDDNCYHHRRIRICERTDSVVRDSEPCTYSSNDARVCSWRTFCQHFKPGLCIRQRSQQCNLHLKQYDHLRCTFLRWPCQ